MRLKLIRVSKRGPKWTQMTTHHDSVHVQKESQQIKPLEYIVSQMLYALYWTELECLNQILTLIKNFSPMQYVNCAVFFYFQQ